MVSAFREFIGSNAMMAYLVMMAPRLVELRRVLKPTGSIYLHCDPTASHYLKLLMDAVFGPAMAFGTRLSGTSLRTKDSPLPASSSNHDVILAYSGNTDISRGIHATYPESTRQYD